MCKMETLQTNTPFDEGFKTIKEDTQSLQTLKMRKNKEIILIRIKYVRFN
jgi:hypothetical protein